MFYRLFIFVFCLFGSTYAQEIRVFKTTDGLPENTGQAILQDPEGYLWIGTQNGLSRFDGEDFLHFKAGSSGLSNNQVEQLHLYRDSLLLISTRSGFDELNLHTYQFRNFKVDADQDQAFNWFGDISTSDSLIYLCNFYGLFELDPNSLKPTNFITTDNVKERTSVKVLFDAEGVLWFSMGSKLYSFKDGKRRFQLDLKSRIHHLAKRQESFYFATSQGLQHWTWIKGIWEHQQSYLANDLCLKSFFDSQQTLWILSTKGLYHIQDSRISCYHSEALSPQRLSHDLCLSICQDRQGQLWIGTGQGLNVIDPRRYRFRHLNAASLGEAFQALSNVEVLAWDNYRNGLWVGAAPGLHWLEYDSLLQSWSIKEIEAKLLQRANIDFIYPQGLEVLIGTSTGALVHLNDQGKAKTLVEPAENFQLRGIIEVGEGKYWLGFANALKFFQSHDSKLIDLPWLPNIAVAQMDFLRDELWVSSPEGLYRIDTAQKTWQVYKPEEAQAAISNTMITDFYDDGKFYWLSSFGEGLFRFDPISETFKNYQGSFGLKNSNVWSLIPDSSRYLWLSTDGGIHRFDPKRENFAQFLAFNDGPNFDDYSMLAHATDPRGGIFFGNPEGITHFYPEKVFLDSSTIPIQVKLVELDYRPSRQNLANLHRGKTIVMGPTAQNLSLGLAGLNFRQGDRIQYFFRFDGEDWIEAEGGLVSLGRPSNGRHLLEVKSRNKDGFESAALVIPIAVVPPYYQTWWFRAIMLLLLIILVGGLVFLYHRRRYVRQIRRLETQRKIQNERERISRDLHDHVGAHLSRIASDLDFLETSAGESFSFQDRITETRAFTADTIRLLRDTIWAIDKDSYFLSELIEKMNRFLEAYLVDLLEWKIACDGNTSMELSSNEAINLLRILQEASQNMLKYSGASLFEIQILAGSSFLKIEICDNGRGFEHAVQEDRPHYGLQNMQRRAEEIGAKLSIDGTKGVRISVELKKGPNQSDSNP